MLRQHNSLEDSLCDVYEHQATIYENAFEIGRKLSSALETGGETQILLADLNVQMDRISVLDAQISETRKQWDRLQRKPGQRLTAVIQRLEPMLRELISVIDTAEEVARAARDRLVPELNRESRGQQMQLVIDEVDRINKTTSDGSRRVRIHAVGFPVVLEQTRALGNTGDRFATLMRTLCQKNGGTFVGLNSTRP